VTLVRTSLITAARVHKFYTISQKQVLDVHEEARRIAVSMINPAERDELRRMQDEKKIAAGGVPVTNPGSVFGSSKVVEPGVVDRIGVFDNAMVQQK